MINLNLSQQRISPHKNYPLASAKKQITPSIHQNTATTQTNSPQTVSFEAKVNKYVLELLKKFEKDFVSTYNNLEQYGLIKIGYKEEELGEEIPGDLAYLHDTEEKKANIHYVKAPSELGNFYVDNVVMFLPEDNPNQFQREYFWKPDNEYHRYNLNHGKTESILSESVYDMGITAFESGRNFSVRCVRETIPESRIPQGEKIREIEDALTSLKSGESYLADLNKNQIEGILDYLNDRIGALEKKNNKLTHLMDLIPEIQEIDIVTASETQSDKNLTALEEFTTYKNLKHDIELYCRGKEGKQSGFSLGKLFGRTPKPHLPKPEAELSINNDYEQDILKILRGQSIDTLEKEDYKQYNEYCQNNANYFANKLDGLEKQNRLIGQFKAINISETGIEALLEDIANTENSLKHYNTYIKVLDKLAQVT